MSRGILFLVSPSFVEGEMPIHVDDQDVKRRIVLVKTLDQLIELLVGIGPIARPPGPECKPRRQRNLSGHTRVIAEGALVIVAVAEKVPILTVARRTRRNP